MPATASGGKRKREEGSDRWYRVHKWLASFERSNKLEDTKADESDLGTLGFMVQEKSYTVPFTGLLRMADALKDKDPKKFNTVKTCIEKNFGPIHNIGNDLIMLANFLKYGAQLMREAGFETIAEGDAEMRSSRDDDDRSGPDSDSD